jgi:hypothetical protein
MVECPFGRCVVCAQTGLVKKQNLDRAREPMNLDGWSDAALRRVVSLALVDPNEDGHPDWEYVAQHPGG